MGYPLPFVDGILSEEQARQTAKSIARTQSASGAIPWFDGGHTDPWDHAQGAMALTCVGRIEEAMKAFDWSRSQQRDDGTWAMRYQDDVIVDPHVDSNFCAYLATALWCFWRVTGDHDFTVQMWPTVARGLEASLQMQRPDGAIDWASVDGHVLPGALVTGNASIHLSLRCGLALAEVAGTTRPDWEFAAARLRHALDHHSELYEPKPTHSMDWYYPVLGGVLSRESANSRIDEGWDEFVVGGLGARCVSTNPWVTGAETCELVLALDALGRTDEARRQFAAMQHLRDDDGSYWTGLVYSDGKRWPVERTTWTSATVILAADALSRTTPANGLFRGDDLPACDWKVTDPCPL